MLVRLLYASRSEIPITNEAIDALLSQCRKNNPSSGITGILCYSDNCFLQVIEGGRKAVNELYNHIVRDERHSEVTVLHYEEVTQRLYGSWTMGKVNLERLNPALVLKYSEKSVLEPYGISGKVSMALLEELISTASVSEMRSK
jgi:Sensors of blue-light using FAD